MFLKKVICEMDVITVTNIIAMHKTGLEKIGQSRLPQTVTYHMGHLEV